MVSGGTPRPNQRCSPPSLLSIVHLTTSAAYFTRAWRPWAVLLGLAILACAPMARADERGAIDGRLPSAPLLEDVLSMAGDPNRPVTLQVTLFTPAGVGPFPLAVVNHGAANASVNNRGERHRFTVLAYYFLSRGYAVALPMMRGFAGSGGALPIAGCDLATVADRDARDIRAVIEVLAHRPGIDASRTVVAGQSFGAWNTLGVGVSPPAGVRGLVSFNAAIRPSDCQAQDSSMATAAAQMGARTPLPSLWFYGDNDSVMPVATWRAVYDHYRAAGGRAELVAFGPYGSDSHQILSDPRSLPFWAPKLDVFLAKVGLPSATTYPQYLPHPAPPATRWAALSDVRAVPFLTDAGRALYQKFLGSARPRAFVIAANGSVSKSSGGYDPLGQALLACTRASRSVPPVRGERRRGLDRIPPGGPGCRPGPDSRQDRAHGRHHAAGRVLLGKPGLQLARAAACVHRRAPGAWRRGGRQARRASGVPGGQPLCHLQYGLGSGHGRNLHARGRLLRCRRAGDRRDNP